MTVTTTSIPTRTMSRFIAPPLSSIASRARTCLSPADDARTTTQAMMTVNAGGRRALGQFASPDPLSPRLAAELLSSNRHVASGPATLNVRSIQPSPRGCAPQLEHPRTPRAADPLAPRLARNLPRCQRPNCPTTHVGSPLRRPARVDYDS